MGCCSLLQGDLPNPGIEPRSPALLADSLPSEPTGEPEVWEVDVIMMVENSVKDKIVKDRCISLLHRVDRKLKSKILLNHGLMK